MKLKVWRLHPDGCRVMPAEKSLQGTANEAAVKWCGPYATANRMGWWLFPPTDIDIMWKGGTNFEYRHLTEYSDYDFHFVRSLLRPSDGVVPGVWSQPGGRTKYTWGEVDDGVVQIWTGIIFQTPPGWCLKIGDPINCVHQGRLATRGPSFAVQEGVLETDWMQYDIWINLKFLVKGKWVYLRRNEFPPLAQLIPVRRDSYDPGWGLAEMAVNRDSPEADGVFKYWVDYNRKKFDCGGSQPLSASLTKDSTTYHRERRKYLACPFGDQGKSRPEGGGPEIGQT